MYIYRFINISLNFYLFTTYFQEVKSLKTWKTSTVGTNLYVHRSNKSFLKLVYVSYIKNHLIYSLRLKTDQNTI